MVFMPLGGVYSCFSAASNCYFINLRRLTKWVPPPVKMTRSYVEDNINRSRKRMDVSALDMLQFHWYVSVDLCATY